MAQERIPQGGPLAVYDPFQSILNQARAGLIPQQFAEGVRGAATAVSSPMGARITGMGLPSLYGAGSLAQGEIAQGVGEIGGGLLGSQLVGGIASGLEKGGTRGKLLGAGVRLAGGLLGGAIGGGVTGAVAGGAAQAAQGLLGGAQQREMARGESPGVTGIPGVDSKAIGFSDSDIAKIEQLSKITGRSQVDIAREMLPISNQYRDAEMQRQMQLNQQTGQITGGLNRQLYTAQLAQGAQAQAGATTREMLTAANPYASSAFQYRGG